MTTPYENNLMPRNTITELCAAWTQSEAEVRQAFAILHTAEQRLASVFGENSRASMRLTPRHNYGGFDWKEPKVALDDLSRQVWSALVQRMELRKVLSLARIKELDKQLATGEGLPPITLENVMAMIETNYNQLGTLMKEKVREVYEMLRPRGWTLTKYKTNQKSVEAGLGTKIVMSQAVQLNWSGQGFTANHYRTDELRALSQVFAMLDGKPDLAGSYSGSICDAISSQTKTTGNTFETDYFKGRCFKNCSLHLEFKRPDLVADFNLIAAGGDKLPRQAAQ